MRCVVARLGGALALSALALAACTDSGSSATPTTSTSSTTATIPGPTPSTTVTPSASSKEQAAADAKAAYLNYRKTVDRVYQNGGANGEAELTKVAAGEQFSFLARQAKSLRDDRQYQTGALKPKTIDVRTVTLPQGRLPQVVLDVCVDTSGRDVVGRDGKSVLPKPQPRFLGQFIVVTRSLNKGWLVTGEDDRQVKAC